MAQLALRHGSLEFHIVTKALYRYLTLFNLRRDKIAHILGPLIKLLFQVQLSPEHFNLRDASDLGLKLSFCIGKFQEKWSEHQNHFLIINLDFKKVPLSRYFLFAMLDCHAHGLTM